MPVSNAAKRRRKAAEEAFRRKVASMGGRVAGEYVNNRTATLCICPAGHECRPRPGNIMQGHQGLCNTCGIINRERPAHSIAAETAFRGRLEELGATLLESGYLGVRTPHHVRCALGHDSWPWPASVIQGQGICPACAGNDSAEFRFRARLDALGATLLEPWRAGRFPHRARCAEGHECRPTPSYVLSGGGVCNVCVGHDSATTEAAFRSLIAALGGTVVGQYIGTLHPIDVICPGGHRASPRPTNVFKGRGMCRYCAGKEWDAFYVVASDTAIKFGITSGDPRPRMGNHFRDGYRTQVRVLRDLGADVAPRLERAVKATLRLAEVEPVKGREYFDIDALALVLDVVDNYPIGEADYTEQEVA